MLGVPGGCTHNMLRRASSSPQHLEKSAKYDQTYPP
jgi:hypothetical protein